jgi:hypothetical protein
VGFDIPNRLLDTSGDLRVSTDDPEGRLLLPISPEGPYVSVSRFDYNANRNAVRTYTHYRRGFWPPIDRCALTAMDLAPFVPALGNAFHRRLASLREVVDSELRQSNTAGVTDAGFNDAEAVAAELRSLAECLPAGMDRDALACRADAVEVGIRDDHLAALADMTEDITIACGHILTWTAKHATGLPTAFGCRSDAGRRDLVPPALACLADISGYLSSLHADLLLSEFPTFAPTQLFFIAGEGNLHPKHIAYFLPDDEGVKKSPFRKTYYFANTHEKLLIDESASLASKFLDVGLCFDPCDPLFQRIPTLGVLGHELGHSVVRPATSYADLHALDWWSSAVLQEVAADVFGILILADVWAAQFGIDPAAVIAYHFAEGLRYMNRGLGHFPDSDGMYLQLSYLVSLGAFRIDQNHSVVATGEPSTVLAGLRSLARVLADTLLADGGAQSAVNLYRMFGPPGGDTVQPLIRALDALPSTSIEYVQDHLDQCLTG